MADSEFLSYNLMLNTGKNLALCATKKINTLTLVFEKKILSEKNQTHSPPPASYMEGP